MSADEPRHGPDDEHGARSHGQHEGGGHGGGGPHGGGEHEEHEGAPEWLISFADNVALQMGFFVILLALAMTAPKSGGGAGEGTGAGGPSDEQLAFAAAMREAFHNPVDMSSTAPEDAPLVAFLRERGRPLAVSPEDDVVDSGSLTKPTGQEGIAGTVYFALSATTFGAEETPTIDGLVEKFRGYNMIIEIRGPRRWQEASTTADNGIELSYRRAHAVADVLVAKGIPFQRLRLTQVGDSEPAKPQAYDPAAHRTNQRVEVSELDAPQPQH